MEMTDAEENRTARRDAARHKRRHGMRVDGASVKVLTNIWHRSTMEHWTCDGCGYRWATYPRGDAPRCPDCGIEAA